MTITGEQPRHPARLHVDETLAIDPTDRLISKLREPRQCGAGDVAGMVTAIMSICISLEQPWWAAFFEVCVRFLLRPIASFLLLHRCYSTEKKAPRDFPEALWYAHECARLILR